MSKVISTKIDEGTDALLQEVSKELNVSKSWIVQEALKQYFNRYENYISDLRIASLNKTISHEEVLAEYELQDQVGRKSIQRTKKSRK